MTHHKVDQKKWQVESKSFHSFWCTFTQNNKILIKYLSSIQSPWLVTQQTAIKRINIKLGLHIPLSVTNNLNNGRLPLHSDLFDKLRQAFIRAWYWIFNMHHNSMIVQKTTRTHTQLNKNICVSKKVQVLQKHITFASLSVCKWDG